MESLIPFFALVLNFQGDPEVPLTPPNACAQLFLCPSLVGWLVTQRGRNWQTLGNSALSRIKGSSLRIMFLGDLHLLHLKVGSQGTRKPSIFLKLSSLSGPVRGTMKKGTQTQALSTQQ